MLDLDTLRAAVLRVFGDGAQHSPDEIRELMKVQFKITPQELLQKHANGNSVFHNNVALALANLQGAPHRGSKAITKVKRNIYIITEYGKDILKRNPSTLSIKDL